MAVSYGKGDKGKATKLHSRIVRSRGACEKCGERNFLLLQTAHIISRRYSATRTDETNAFCLCAACHRYYTDWPKEFSRFITDKIGTEKYEQLKAKAETVTKMAWSDEVERLKLIAKERGVV